MLHESNLLWNIIHSWLFQGVETSGKFISLLPSGFQAPKPVASSVSATVVTSSLKHHHCSSTWRRIPVNGGLALAPKRAPVKTMTPSLTSYALRRLGSKQNSWKGKLRVSTRLRTSYHDPGCSPAVIFRAVVVVKKLFHPWNSIAQTSSHFPKHSKCL